MVIVILDSIIIVIGIGIETSLPINLIIRLLHLIHEHHHRILLIITTVFIIIVGVVLLNLHFLCFIIEIVIPISVVVMLIL